jgi:hypothetical protein
MRVSDRLIDERLRTESAEAPQRNTHDHGPKKSGKARSAASSSSPERKKGQQKWQNSAKAKSFYRKMGRMKGRFDK